MAEYETYSGGADASAGLLGGFNAGLKAQQQNFNQQQTLVEQVNKNASDLFATAAAVAKANMEAGNPPSAAANQIHSLQSAAVELLTNAANRGMLGPNGAQIITAVNQRFAALGGLPGPQQPQVAAAPTPTQPVAQPTAQAQPQLSQSEVITPSQVAAANPPAPQPMTPNQQMAQGFSSLPAEDASLPSGAKPVQSALPPAVGVGNFTPEAVDMMARQLIKGNERVLMGLGYGAKGAEIRGVIRNRAAQIAGYENLAPDQVNQNVADFAGMKTGAQALGRREAGVTGAILGATKTLPRVLDTSEAVDRTSYPDLNKIILAAKTRTGDEAVVKYGIAVNTYINNYARALGAGNAVLTDTARKEASDILQQAWSKGQIRAALAQMQLELESELQGAHEARRSFISGQQLRQESTKDLTNNPPQQPNIPAPPSGFIRTR